MMLKAALLAAALVGSAAMPAPASAQYFPSGPGPIPFINALTAGIPNVIGYGRCAYGYRCGGMYGPGHGHRHYGVISRRRLPNGCIETVRRVPGAIRVHGDCPPRGGHAVMDDDFDDE